MPSYYVYILTNKTNTVVYTGVTNNLERRIHEHKHKVIKGFTSRYNLNKLVYYEQTENIEAAILFEKKIKGWSREKKNALISGQNPEWHDLALNGKVMRFLARLGMTDTISYPERIEGFRNIPINLYWR